MGMFTFWLASVIRDWIFVFRMTGPVLPQKTSQGNEPEQDKNSEYPQEDDCPGFHVASSILRRFQDKWCFSTEPCSWNHLQRPHEKPAILVLLVLSHNKERTTEDSRLRVDTFASVTRRRYDAKPNRVVESRFQRSVVKPETSVPAKFNTLLVREMIPNSGKVHS